MRLIFLTLIFSLTSFAQGPLADGCPAVRFSSALSAPLLPNANSHRILVKQSSGSYTAYEQSNTAPYATAHVIPSFDEQLRPCSPVSTGLSPYVLAINQNPSANGYAIASLAQGSSVNVTALDANLNFIGEKLFPSGTQVQLADVNGDGYLDVITINQIVQTDYKLAIYLGSSSGSFTFASSPGLPSANNTPVLLIADLNGDGKPDIVFIANSAVGVLYGNGDGTFQSAQTLATGYSPMDLAVADLNGDGKPDLMFTDTNTAPIPIALGPPIVAVALATGSGAFATPVDYNVGAEGPIAVGDLNGDGFPDILTGDFTILFGDGTGAFPHRSDYIGPEFTSYPPSPYSTIIADFNHDGIPDIVTALGNSSVMAGDTATVLLGTGSGKFAGPLVSLIPNLPAPPPSGLLAMASSDFNGDGILDLATLDYYGNVSVLLGVGNGTFASKSSFASVFGSVTGGFLHANLAIADFNDDGHPDIAVAGSATGGGSSSTILLGNGDGTFGMATTAAPAGVINLTVADFNKDGKPDVALLSSEPAGLDAVTILLGNGNGTFSTGATYPTAGATSSVVAGDFTGNGNQDLAIAGATLTLLTGNGDGTFSIPVILPTPFPIKPTLLAAADFNHDGKLDLAVSLNFGMAIMLGAGAGAFEAPVFYSGNGGVLLPGDLNGDGILDLVSGNGFRLGNGDGTFQPFTLLPGFSFNAEVLGDFNGDGKLDLAQGLAQNAVGVGAATFLNESVTAPEVSIVSAATLGPGVLAPGSIATAFGALAANAPIDVTDSTGSTLPATVLYSSSSQANFIIPSAADAGPLGVIINPAGAAPVASAVLSPIAPQFFSVDATGLAAAYVTQTFEKGALAIQDVFTLQGGALSPAPIDVTAGPTYLTLFGTGLDAVPNPGNLSGFPVAYYGPAPGIPGVQQVNLMLPSSAAGSGLTSITLGLSPVFFVIQ